MSRVRFSLKLQLINFENTMPIIRKDPFILTLSQWENFVCEKTVLRTFLLMYRYFKLDSHANNKTAKVVKLVLRVTVKSTFQFLLVPGGQFEGTGR